jgi:alanine-glyoxylate transaminase/serine-glyoxylate transaminase/serine-pyruvate transaminase
MFDRHLFGPGPSNLYPEAIAGASAPILGHLDPGFLDILDSACDGLRTVFGTENRRTLPLSATGSAGMEASFVNTVHDGDVVVVGVNGLFGERMCDVAERCGARVVRVDHEWGTPIDAGRMAAAHPNPAIMAAVHAETSTGVRSDIAALGEVKGDALLLVDMVTSIGGIEIQADAWGVDVAYAGSQKCLGVAPGLAPFTINDRAFERRVPHPRSWYLDLGLLGGYVGEASRQVRRTYHHTAPTTMIASLEASLRGILDEGLEKVFARHAETGRILTEGLAEMGLELFAAEGYRLPELTTVKVPEDVDSAEVRRYLLEQHNVEIGAGVGKYASSVWRIGMMGHNARPDRALLMLATLKDALQHVRQG